MSKSAIDLSQITITFKSRILTINEVVLCPGNFSTIKIPVTIYITTNQAFIHINKIEIVDTISANAGIELKRTHSMQTQNSHKQRMCMRVINYYDPISLLGGGFKAFNASFNVGKVLVSWRSAFLDYINLLDLLNPIE